MCWGGWHQHHSCFFSLVESCPPDLLTILSLLWARKHINLQTALCGSCQNAHFTSWLFQAHHQGWHGRIKLERWYLVMPNWSFSTKSKAQITCAVKQEEKVNEIINSTCWGSAGWLTGKTWFKGDNVGSYKGLLLSFWSLDFQQAALKWTAKMF